MLAQFDGQIKMNETSKSSQPGARQKFYFQIITTDTADTPGTTLVLHFDDQRYIFGHVAEGTQRACIERGIGLKKVENIFLTGETKWLQNGGLIGLILTMADVQQAVTNDAGSEIRARLNIHGGPKLLHLMACARRFVFRTGMPLSIYEASVSEARSLIHQVYADNNIRVWGIPLRNLIPKQFVQHESTEATESDSDDQSQLENENITAEQDLRRNIVTNMFDSDWRRDRLVETSFKDVKMPATVWVRNPQTKDLDTFTCLNHESTPNLSPDTIVLSRNPWPASLVGEMPSASNLPKRISMSYIIKGQPQRGMFDPKKAKSLGVTPGPDFNKLTLGESIKVGDTVVTSDMVLGPPRPGKGIAIFDVPHRNHLYDLEQQIQTWPSDVMEGVEAVLWMVDINLPQILFQRILKSMGNVKHIISHRALAPNYLALESSAMTASNLSQISAQHFPKLVHNNTFGYQQKQTLSAEDFLQTTQDSLKNEGADIDLRLAQRGLKLKFEPELVLDETEVPTIFDVTKYKSPVMGKARQLLTSKTSFQGQEDSSLIPPSTVQKDLEEPEIIALGTGSAMPSKYRNVSATLLRMPHGMGNYLFDCGENTLGQLKRIFEPEELDKLLLDLRVIWISHLHADHHLGTISILQQRKAAQSRIENQTGVSNKDMMKDLMIMSEVNMIDFLNDYHSVEKVVSPKFRVWPIVCHHSHGVTLDRKPFDFKSRGLPIQKVETVRVSHCHGAQAISMTFRNGFKFSYSGDCRPSTSFTEIGLNSDILVHEATFEDDKEGDAMAKKHCTTGEALGVALKMKAKNVILTHFSQRYQKVPVLSNVKLPEQVHFEEADQVEDPTMPPIPIEEAEENTNMITKVDSESINNNKNSNLILQPESSGIIIPNICIAFDYMRIKVSEMASMKLQNLFPAIERMFDLQRQNADRERENQIKRELEINQKKQQDKGKKQKKNNNNTHNNNNENNKLNQISNDSESNGTMKKRMKKNKADQQDFQIHNHNHQQQRDDEEKAKRIKIDH